MRTAAGVVAAVDHAPARPAAPSEATTLRPPPSAGPRPTNRRRRAIGGVLAAVGGISLVVAGLMAMGSGRPWTGDHFDRSTIDARRWTTTVEQNATIVAGRGVTVTLAAGDRDAAAMVTTTCAFSGDFDVEVAYTVGARPRGDAATVAILAGGYGVARTSAAALEFNRADAGTQGVSRAISDGSGLLRLVRSGSSLRNFTRVLPTDVWQEVTGTPRSTGHPDSEISLRVSGPANSTPRRVTLRDFVIHKGSC